MASIYLHIPFCKQACHYCDFHFSTSLKKKSELLAALVKEITLRKDEIDEEVETIYFGGGTPSLLSIDEIQKLIESIYENFKVSSRPEITLEANPDDLSKNRIVQLSNSPINRLSIGVQSFFEEDLQLMNRAHNAEEARNCIENASEYFENLSVDLIYGIPKMGDEHWRENLGIAFDYNIPHLSCYALTVEPKTALKKFIEKGIVPPVEDEVAEQHHAILVTETEKKGYINYEFSNFGKPGFYSQNNQAYWYGKPYLGVGPSAHSYDGKTRSWNVANNTKYIQKIETGELPLKKETLSKIDRYNEFIMTRLRLKEGFSVEEISKNFGKGLAEYALRQSKIHLEKGTLQKEENQISVTKKGKFLSDGIASDLFFIPLNDQ